MNLTAEVRELTRVPARGHLDWLESTNHTVAAGMAVSTTGDEPMMCCRS